MEKVLSAMMDLGGTVCLKLEGKEGKQREISFDRIRCGISWPLGNYPGYFCVVGLLSGAKPGQMDSLIFLMEGEEEVADDLLRKVINAAKDLRFSEFFTDCRKPEWVAFCTNMGRHLRTLARDLRLKHVPFAENFTAGRDLIRKWGRSGALKIPEDSIVHAQLVGKEPQIISDTEENRFYAINALRYVTLAFEKVPVLCPPLKIPSSFWIFLPPIGLVSFPPFITIQLKLLILPLRLTPVNLCLPFESFERMVGASP